MYAIANTDYDWFNFIKDNTNIKIINFWTPTPWNVKHLNKGDKLYFFLKNPIRKIGGYGEFLYYDNMFAVDAWNKFGKGNCTNNLYELVEKTSKYAIRNSKKFIPSKNPTIGCIVLNNYVLFDEEDYVNPIDVGLDYNIHVERWKYFKVGIAPIDSNNDTTTSPFELVNAQADHVTISKKSRKGQYKFRNNVLKAYNYRCAISGETCIEVLEVAHIQEYINEDSNHIQNGLPLRRDLHTLFDDGLITIDTAHRVQVSSQINSETYKKFNNKNIYLPTYDIYFPNKKALELHNKEVFRK